MSTETTEWLYENVMFGNTDLRKTWNRSQSWSTDRPWFAGEDYEYAYPGPIPIEEVMEHMFYWEPQVADLTVRIQVSKMEVADGVDDDGNYYKNMIVPDKVAIMRPDTSLVMGVFGRDSYRVHSRKKWLLDNVANLTDDELKISSVIQLKGGAVSVVALELGEDIDIAGAGAIRPCLMAYTSSDGSLATGYSITLNRPECDNSFRLAQQQATSTVKFKHTSGSAARMLNARDALGLVYKVGEQAEAWFAELADIDVSDSMFRQITASLVPVPDVKTSAKDGSVENKRSITMAENKHEDLWNLWASDRRAAPWRNTLAGAFHAVNTWHEHVNTNDDVAVRRQVTGVLNGTFDKADAEFWSVVGGLGIRVPEMVDA